jgi:hypothetical protein
VTATACTATGRRRLDQLLGDRAAIVEDAHGAVQSVDDEQLTGCVDVDARRSERQLRMSRKMHRQSPS